MNPALWKKAVTDARLQFLLTGLLLCLFAWLYVWLSSLVPLGSLTEILRWLPVPFQGFLRSWLGVELADMASPAGRVAFLYIHVVTVLLSISWAVGRGSSTVSGSISDGTMEFIVTLPVRRLWVIVVPAVVSTLGAALLALSVWLGIWIGFLTVRLEQELSIWLFLPGSVNLFAMTFCLTGVATMFSSCDRDRWRTIWLTVGFFVLSTIVKLVARMWTPGAWLRYFTFLNLFEPQQIVLMRDDAWRASLAYNLPLLALGLLCYLIAIIIFSWRDIPIPR
jgi:ABC-2 type transport system permease protein